MADEDYVIEYFESTEDLPVKRFQRFNKYLMKDADVGADCDGLLRRMASLSKFIEHDMKSKAVKELSNLEYCIFNAMNEQSPKTLAHAVMIKKLDGVLQVDYSEEGLKRLADKVGEFVTKKRMDSIVETLKKK
jgi:hypothetical protein